GVELVAVQEQEAVPGWQYRRLRRVWRETGQERVDRFVLVRRERADVDQGRDVLVGSGFGDDGAAVGVADEHDRVVLRVDDQPGRGGIALKRQGRVLHHGHLVTVLLEQVIDRPPAGPVYEPAVHENDVRHCVCVHDDLFPLPRGRSGRIGNYSPSRTRAASPGGAANCTNGERTGVSTAWRCTVAKCWGTSLE